MSRSGKNEDSIPCCSQSRSLCDHQHGLEQETQNYNGIRRTPRIVENPSSTRRWPRNISNLVIIDLTVNIIHVLVLLVHRCGNGAVSARLHDGLVELINLSDCSLKALHLGL